FDFDKVFVDYPPLIPNFLIDWFYKTKNHKLTYRFPGILEQKIRILSHHHVLRPPIEENIRSFAKIAQDRKYELFLVSGRFGFLEDRTKHWLYTYNFEHYFKQIHFNFENEQPHLFKERIITHLQIDTFIDDDLDLLFYLADKHPDISFFWVN